MPPPDPRPLPGEPLALDLLDTQFVVDGTAVDLLSAPATLTGWLRHAVPGPVDAPPEEVRDALVPTRDALRAVATAVAGGTPPAPAARDALNDVLGHGRARRVLDDHGRPAEVVEADGPAWRPAVLAAYDLLDLLTDRADRIRQCEHGRCVLWFLDTSRNGTRRWCSMAVCGNRAKAERHYRRTHAAGAGPGAGAAAGQRRRATS